MSATLGSFTSADPGFGPASCTVTVPTGTTNGDLLVVFWMASKENTAAPTTPTGWSLLTPVATAGTGSNGVSRVFYRTAASEPASYTFPGGGGGIVSPCFRVPGGTITGAAVSWSSGTGTTITCPSRTGAPGGLMLCAATELFGGGAPTWTWSGATKIVDQSGGNYIRTTFAQETISASGTTNSPTATTNDTPSGNWQSMSLFIPSSAVPVTLADVGDAEVRVGRGTGDLVGTTTPTDTRDGGARAYPPAADALAVGVVLGDLAPGGFRTYPPAPDSLVAQLIANVVLGDTAPGGVRTYGAPDTLAALAIPVSGTRIGRPGGDLIGTRPADPTTGGARLYGPTGETIGRALPDPAATPGTRVGYALDQLIRGVVLGDTFPSGVRFHQTHPARALLAIPPVGGTRAYLTGRDLVGLTLTDFADASVRVGQDVVDDALTGATSGTLSNLPILRVLADFTATYPTRPASDVVGHTVELTRAMAVDKLSTKRGRQYELGNPEAGTASLNFRDPFELLNPANPASPYQSGGNSMVSYRPIAVRAVWAGVSYQLYTGYIERYPQTFINMGFHGVKPLECVDLLGMLSNVPVHQSYFDTVMADEPAIWIPCTDAAGPGAVYVQSPAALTSAGKALPGNPRQGTSAYYQTALLVGGTGLRMQDVSNAGGQVNWGGDQFLDGSAATSVSASNQGSTTEVDASVGWPQGTIMSAGGTVSIDCTNSTIEYWYKFDAGKVHFAVFQSVIDGNYLQPSTATSGNPVGNFLVGGLNYDGVLLHAIRLPGTTSGSNTFSYALDSSGGYPDGQWHHAVIRFSTAASNYYLVDFIIDGVAYVGPALTRPYRIGANSILTIADTAHGDPTSAGSVFGIAYYPYALSDYEIYQHYMRGVGNEGETTTARAARLFNTYVPGAAVQLTQPESDLRMAPDYDYGVYPVPVPGQDTVGSQSGNVQPYSVLESLQTVDVAEQGQTFVRVDGQAFVEGRRYRSDTVPNAIAQGTMPPFPVCGERTDLGELPYLDIKYDFDPTYIYTQTQLTRGQAGQALIQDGAAEATFGVRSYTETIDLDSDWDVFQLGMFILQRYGVQLLRISSITFDPASNPQLWPFVLGLEISQGLRVNRRTSAGFTISGLYWVEAIAHDVDAAASTWKVTLQLSPMFGGGALPGMTDDGTSTLPIARTLGVDTMVIY